MKIYPAIDLINGKCVRLHQGQFDQQTDYDFDPVVLAQEYAQQGAEYLHVVDLDGSRQGQPLQADLAQEMSQKSGLKTQIGGGVRSFSDVVTLLEKGLDRVVVGSLAVKQPETFQKLLKEVGGNRLTLAVDVRLSERGEPFVLSNAWQSQENILLWDLVEGFLADGLEAILCTDVSLDGTLKGPNVELYRQVSERFPGLEVQASGGVHALSDLEALKEAGCGGVVIGKALLEGRFRLEEAMKC